MKIDFKRIIKVAGIFLGILFVLSIIFANIDYSRTKNNKPPILAQHIKILNKKDNVKFWHGLGYIVVECLDYGEGTPSNEGSPYKLFYLTYSYACIYSFDVEVGS